MRRRFFRVYWWYLFLHLSVAKLHPGEQNQIIENVVWTSVFNLLTNSMSVNGQVCDIANRHPGFPKHFICKETLSCLDSPTGDQDTSSIKYTRRANFTKLCSVIEERVPPLFCYSTTPPTVYSCNEYRHDSFMQKL